MRPALRLAVAVGALATVAVPTVVAVAAQGRPERLVCVDHCDDGEATAADLAEWEQRGQLLARRQLGYTTWPYFVPRRAVVPATDPIERWFSPAELAEIEARQRLLSDAITAHDVATRTLPSSFGGAWFEQRGKGIVHLLVTDESTPAEQACLRSEFAPDAAVVFDRVAWTMRDLRAAVERINSNEQRWREDGISFHRAAQRAAQHGRDPRAGSGAGHARPVRRRVPRPRDRPHAEVPPGRREPLGRGERPARGEGPMESADLGPRDGVVRPLTRPHFGPSSRG